MSQLRELVDGTETMSIREQCQLLGISRSGWYYECHPESSENLAIMRRLDELHLKNPVYGSRRLGIPRCFQWPEDKLKEGIDDY